ncbi:hypothetical protein JOF35_000242 [Streptomyces demainii]|uniref:Flavodoxin family protein n=1 Tax=Streptomyces demainii TaxID=588122 RepID=A0ABT9KHT2_9ACTN|nr:hypothetical protein [Streptomyces demainii]
MEERGVTTEVVRAVDHDIATGVWPDMREHGWESDEWPVLHKRVMDADILVLCGPIWLGDKFRHEARHRAALHLLRLLNERGSTRTTVGAEAV